METMYLRIFQGELERQCKFALIAVDDMKRALQMHDLERIWYPVQNFLVAAGNISKILWPSKKDYSERGVTLRKSLKVSDDSPLVPRTFRNHFKHFDERLELWATSSERHKFADYNVGPPNMILGLEPRDYLRNFDTTNFTVMFHGDRYSLSPIINAIQTLLANLSAESKTPHWIK